MNELEKLKSDILLAVEVRRESHEDFIDRINGYMDEFRSAMDRAREIERQAGIGEEK